MVQYETFFIYLFNHFPFFSRGLQLARQFQRGRSLQGLLHLSAKIPWTPSVDQAFKIAHRN